LERDDVVDAHRFGGEERLAIARADHRAVVRRVMADGVVQRLPVRVYLARLRGAAELRLEASDGLDLLLELVADVHDERRLLEVLPEAHAMDDLERAVPGMVRRDFRQTGDEARVAHELRRDTMVRMSSLTSWRDHDARLVSTNGVGDDRARLRRVDDSRVRQ